MSETGKKITNCILMSLSAAAIEVFLLLCLSFFTDEWSTALLLAVLIIGSLANAAILAVDVVFCFLGKEVIYKSCITVYIFLLIAGAITYVLLRTGFLEVARDEQKFQEFLRRSGTWMAPVFILLQFLQVVVLPIPSTVTVVAGAALFGPLVGSLYSLLGIVTGSLVAFLIGRYAGHRVVAWLIGEETLQKWLKKIKGKDKLLLSAMFLLPVFPDDVLCFVAGLSSMSLFLFLGVIIISRILAVFTTSYSISVIPFNTWWGITIWCVLFALVILLFVFLYKKSDAILAWIAKKFHRETRVEEKTEKDEFTLQIVDPNGAIVKKGVKKEESSSNDNPSGE